MSSSIPPMISLSFQRHYQHTQHPSTAMPPHHLPLPCFLLHTTCSTFTKPLSKPKNITSTHYTSPIPIASLQSPNVSRRMLLTLLPFLSVPLLTNAQTVEKLPIPKYDATKSRRYIEIGRPAPDRPAPTFKGKTITIDEGLDAQDVKSGNGPKIETSSLVVARWVMLLADGTTVDDSNENLAALFRPGAHQVPPGIEDAVVGMRVGGLRRVRGTSERILTSVRMGYDIGERSLVPNGSVIFIDLFVDGVNPYGGR